MKSLSGKIVSILVVLGLVAGACQLFESTPPRVLYYADETGGDASVADHILQATGEASWKVMRTDSTDYFREDSLRRFRSVLASVAALQGLDHRSAVALKRFMEAGGQVVVLGDTASGPVHWPWLSTGGGEPGHEHLRPLAVPRHSEELTSRLADALASGTRPDYSRVTTPAVPESSRFARRVLLRGMDEPMQMAILPSRDVLIVERKGAVKLYDAARREARTIARLEVFSGIEDGLLGVAPDPDFEENGWVYFYYAAGGERAVNRLSRMRLRGGHLNEASEQTLLEIPTQRRYCCHAAGYLQFGPDGLLYLATGDNTNAEAPFEIGQPPLDERPGHELADDQATAANTNDLRGKILRIRPEAGGGYSIPRGNLFAKGTPDTRPEIYVMGLRNPFRFSIDPKTGHLYWGDIGPDTKVAGRDGSKMSYDEINHAGGPGFYGWPYFLGDNDAFPMYDFATGRSGPPKDPAAPLNDSPNNTGLRALPPARPAMIWYGPERSARFPLVGSGGASAMAGPVYHSDRFAGSQVRLPGYYDRKLLIYDWVRNWIMAVTLGADGGYAGMEPFLEHMDFASPVDLQLGPDGALYVLEYGSNWFAKNADARLTRIEYQEGNRRPIAEIQTTNKLYGAAPFRARFSGSESMDFDRGDELTYRWKVEGNEFTGEHLSYTFERPGRHEVTLTVTDTEGAEDTATAEVTVGNAPPQVRIATQANRSFYWDGATLDYRVQVRDREDTPVDTTRAEVAFEYLPRGEDLAVILADPGQGSAPEHTGGRALIASHDCRACHAPDQTSVGPSYRAIADRYAGRAGVVEPLAAKIIEGGSGVWGSRAMTPHPELSRREASEMVRYILSQSGGSTNSFLPLRGTLKLTDHIGQGEEGVYLLMARYTDGGANGVKPLTGRAHLALRSPLVQIEDYDEGTVRLATVTTKALTYAAGVRHGSFAAFQGLDLTAVGSMTFRVRPAGTGGRIEVRLGGPDGRLIGTAEVRSAGEADSSDWRPVTAGVQEVPGEHDLYLVFMHPEASDRPLFDLDWVRFIKKADK